MIRPESAEFSQADTRSDTPKGIRDPGSHKRERPRRGGGVARTRLLFSFLFFLSNALVSHCYDVDRPATQGLCRHLVLVPYP